MLHPKTIWKSTLSISISVSLPTHFFQLMSIDRYIEIDFQPFQYPISHSFITCHIMFKHHNALPLSQVHISLYETKRSTTCQKHSSLRHYNPIFDVTITTTAWGLSHGSFCLHETLWPLTAPSNDVHKYRSRPSILMFANTAVGLPYSLVNTAVGLPYSLVNTVVGLPYWCLQIPQ